jgi:1-acyl-sn-glycerol-3-phosphate acyltransferase
MARQAGVPVVPVAVKNSDVLMGKGTGVARSGILEMVVKPPLRIMTTGTDEEIDDQIAEARHEIAKELGVEP